MIRVETIALPRRPVSLLRRLATMVAIARQRRALSSLDADRLQDIGVTAEMAAAEAARPVWDVPAHWRE